jgi:Tol biopolymer transport system component
MRPLARASIAAAIALTAGRGIAGTTQCVSVGANGEIAALPSSVSWGRPALSADGRFVVFTSPSPLVADDTNGVHDVFVRDLQAGTTTRVSLSSSGGQADQPCAGATISADGRYVAFSSQASNLVAGDVETCRDASPQPCVDVFVRDRLTGETTRESAGLTGHSTLPSLSADGRFVAFTVVGMYFGSSRSAQVLVRDRQTGAFERVSAPLAPGGEATGNDACVSADGRFVVFDGSVSTGVPSDVLLRDRVARQTIRLRDGASRPAISADGRFVVFEDGGVQVLDRETGFVHSCSAPGPRPNGGSFPSISGDGRFVVYQSDAPFLVPADLDRATDVFVCDLLTHTTRRVSVSSSGGEGDGASWSGTLSSDGRFVAFASAATHLVTGDANGVDDVFVHELDFVTLSSIEPSTGSEAGGDLVTLQGTGFTDLAAPEVEFGSAHASIVGVQRNRLHVRTPPGTDTSTVRVFDANGAWRLDASFTYVEPALAARYGNVNAARGDREDVLLVNATSGDAETRTLTLSPSASVRAVMVPPTSRASARFVLYGWRGEPDATTLTSLPRGAGMLVFPAPFTGGAPQPRAIWNNLGFARTLGPATLASRAAPSIVFSLPHGVGRAATATLQGLIEDDAAGIPQHVSVTNAIVLRMR